MRINILLYLILNLIVLSLVDCTSRKTTTHYLTSNDVIKRKYLSENPSETPKLNAKQAFNQFKYLDYAPDARYPEHTPMRRLRVNMHFIDSQRGGQNFSKAAAIEFGKALLDAANASLHNNQKMFLPKGRDTPVLPPRYEYVLTGMPNDSKDNGIYFHRDDKLYYMNKKKRRGEYSIFDPAQYEKFAVQKDKVLNMFFVEHHPDSIISKTYKASGDGVGMSNWLKVTSAYQSHLENPNMSLKELAKHFVGILNHEIGHTLGLSHTWASNDGCEDTPKNPNCWNINEGGKKCNTWNNVSNNMMDYNAWRNAITPCQLAKVHYKMAKKSSSQRKFLIPSWCVYKKEATITIPPNETVTWNSIKDLEGDIVIENGARLEIKSMISLPQNARILVKSTATLTLNGATLTNRCGQKWEGIIIQTVGKQRGTVEMLESSKIENVVHAIGS